MLKISAINFIFCFSLIVVAINTDDDSSSLSKEPPEYIAISVLNINKYQEFGLLIILISGVFLRLNIISSYDF